MKWVIGGVLPHPELEPFGKAVLFCNFQNRLLTFKTFVRRMLLRFSPPKLISI